MTPRNARKADNVISPGLADAAGISLQFVQQEGALQHDKTIAKAFA